MTEREAEEARERLEQVTAHWGILVLEAHVLERASRPFPAEPIRTLDALHIASALVIREAVTEVSILSLDGRVRQCASSLDFAIVPEEEPSDSDDAVGDQGGDA